MTIKKLFLFFIIVMILGNPVVYASTTNHAIPLLIGDDIDYPPFSFIDESGNPTGFNIELTKAIAEIMSFQVQFKLGNWHDIMEQLKDGEIDGISGMFYSADREHNYNFTIKHTSASGDIFTRRDVSVTSLEDLRGSKVVVQADDIVHEFLKKEDMNIELIEVSTVAEALQLISYGEYDYAAVLKLPGHYIINRQQLTNLKSNKLSLAPQNYSMAVHKHNDSLLSMLNEGLVILKTTGKYQEIYDQWLGIYEEKNFWEKLQHYAWIFYTLIALLILLLIWTLLLRKVVASRTKELLMANTNLQESKEELIASNEELEATLQQLTATEEELRSHYNQLEESEKTFRILFEGSSDAILLLENDIIIDCNPATVELLGYDSKEEIVGKTPWDISPQRQLDGKSSKDKALEVVQTAFHNGKCRFEWYHHKKDGTLLLVDVMLTSISLKDKKVFHVLWRDISQQKQMESKLKYLSYHDQLTGLYNRRFFEEKLKQLDIPRNFPLTIMMADVNGLKLTNDAFGHTVGDELLKKVGEVLKKGCRLDDVIARLGGDEFIILLPKTDAYEAEKIVKRITDLALKEKVHSIDLSISFGWETKYEEDEKIQEIFRQAEDNMYKKKLFEGPSMRGKTINLIINTLHEKNKREEEHSYRVSALCKHMGETLDLSKSQIQELKIVGLLHDIGKIAIDENILNKPGSLSEEEWKEIKRHPEIGYRILSSVNDMSEMAEYVLAHHERWDGKGYPKGLKEKEVPLQARIIAIADAYDAMTSERSYRSPLSQEEALKELNQYAGIQFDPELVKIFSQMVVD